MKHLFIPYELAIIAKEKKFNEPCLTSYYDTGRLSTDLIISLEDKQLTNEFVNCSAPLYQQIVDWFREKHKIHIHVSHWTEQPVGDEIWTDCYQNFINGDALDVSIFKSYYEALKKAIEEAFKQI